MSREYHVRTVAQKVERKVKLYQVDTKMAEQRFLLQAIADLGLTHSMGGEMVDGDGSRHEAELMVRRDSGAPVGFVRQPDGTLTAMSTDAGLRGLVGQISQAYNFRVVLATAAGQGFAVVSQERTRDQVLKARLTRHRAGNVQEIEVVVPQDGDLTIHSTGQAAQGRRVTCPDREALMVISTLRGDIVDEKTKPLGPSNITIPIRQP